jgi:hypothetical protein
MSSLLRTGPVADTKIVIGYQPDPDLDDDEQPTDVFPEEPDTPLGPMSVSSSEMIIVPENIYSAVTLDALTVAPTYYVTADHVRLLEVAAAAFDEFDLMPRMPTRSGFVVLARPIELPMPGGATQPVRAFAWNTWSDVNTSMGTPGRAGEVWTFSSRKRDTGLQMVRDASSAWPSKKAWNNDADLLPCYADWLVTGVPLPPVAESVAVADARVQAHRWFAQHYGSPRRDSEGNMILPTPQEWQARITAMQARYDQYLAAGTERDSTGQYGFWQPYLAAFVLLLTQQITIVDEQQATPSSARLAGQVSRHRPTSVTVVDVRHSQRPGDDDSPAGERRRGALTTRHPVGAHWKWQPYGTGRALRRRILVPGYVRGPKDAPLVVKPRVIRL